MSEPTYTEKDWNDTRTAFASSIMVDTQISSLAQNLDGPVWPVKSKDETPAKYIDLSYEEALELLALKGQTADKLDLLMSILKETLAFDSPFGDMVEQTEAASVRDNPLLKNMARIAVPEDFPISLTALGADTVEFCKLENLKTLGEFAVFAQGMSQNVIIGGDFRKLLNALSNVDEVTLSEILPFRKGSKGLHLIEALGQATRLPNPIPKAKEASVWFADEFAQLKKDFTDGTGVERQLGVLGNVPLEKKVSDLIRQLIKPGSASSSSESDSGKGGFFKRFFKK
ncbi:MAG TPA: hypothetical protein VFE25_03205 [Opitutaceae bacterium]|jgi:hypothetical protein|nr:hypothetical protein [Opitutaceae bacterium]